MNKHPAAMSALFNQLMARHANPAVMERLLRERTGSYEVRVAEALLALGSTFEELWHVQQLLKKAEQFQEIRVLLKLYVIGWATLSDIVAMIINEVYNLGYAEQ